MNLSEYYEAYGSRVSQESEKLFIDEFLYPLLGSKIAQIVPQYPFIDSTGKQRRIDFAYVQNKTRLALEVNGETYHAEGIIPNEMFDDNLFRQNEILAQGYQLLRFSYSQLQSPIWRPLVHQALRNFFGTYAAELISEYSLQPTPLQQDALQAIDFYRGRREWRRGVVILPTGTGKTILSALDAKRHGGKVLFLVHRLDILRQSIDAYRLVWPEMNYGVLTGEVRENQFECDVLFASKDTLRRPEELVNYGRTWFNYIVVDEVHHGQSATYREVLTYFEPDFMLGMTATPDRTDRRDIFELFDYQKIFELPLAEAIERGFLVPYTYYGLTDNIDYSRIRYQNNKYRVDDLERQLLIPERTEAVIREYLDKGQGDKAIGFCVSIDHAERMAFDFQTHGISAIAIHSGTVNREQLIQNFRDNQYQVVFTVDLFNEGIDFPNVRVLLFLRPTESKTVFIQQLGRGLRLHPGKDRVRVLDFIGNYKRANQIRKHLSTSSTITRGEHGKKVIYTYSPGCEVIFNADVEEILDAQDAQELGLSQEDLIEAYYALTEQLGRKPSRIDIDRDGQYRSGEYAHIFGSWIAFLRQIGEYTEASYHYPQGVHLGHILSVLKYFGDNRRAGTHFDDEYIRLRGELGEGRLSTYRRQVKYKLLAAMELGVLTDDRNYPDASNYTIELTPLGIEMYQTLQPVFSQFDLSFEKDSDGIPSSRMKNNEGEYNQALRQLIDSSPTAKEVVYRVLLNMPAVHQMLAFLYHISRSVNIQREEIYQQFFQAPFVRQFCDQEGIEEASDEASRRRCPFLLNLLDACGIIQAGRREIIVNKLVLLPALVAPYRGEEPDTSAARLRSVQSTWNDTNFYIPDEDLSILRELFGAAFLTSEYHLKQLEVVGG
ncbi:MAG: DEAD/DEAH box helicase [Chloroflexi bacterium]|nr:DEAD/DEAH box helicase [Chloroflexota bacterium]